VETILQDVRYAVRALAKAPAFTAVALVTLATAIGANATVFSFVNALLLSPPAGVRDPGSLIAIYTSDFSSGPYGASSLPDYESIRTDTTAFAELAALREEAATLGRFGDAAERVRTVAVSGEFLAIVGVRPLAGRLIARPDTSPDQPNVAVLGHALWQRAFGGDPADRRLNLGDVSLPVVFYLLDQQFTGRMMVVTRTSSDAALVADTVRRTVSSINREVAVFRTVTLEEHLSEALTANRLIVALVATCGGLALALALIGVYGIVSYTVARRTREIGLRMALGATPWQVRRLLLADNGGVVAFGLRSECWERRERRAFSDRCSMASAALILMRTDSCLSWSAR